MSYFQNTGFSALPHKVAGLIEIWFESFDTGQGSKSSSWICLVRLKKFEHDGLSPNFHLVQSMATLELVILFPESTLAMFGCMRLDCPQFHNVSQHVSTFLQRIRHNFDNYHHFSLMNALFILSSIALLLSFPDSSQSECAFLIFVIQILTFSNSLWPLLHLD